MFRLERKRREKEEQVAYKLEQEIALWDPNKAAAGGGGEEEDGDDAMGTADDVTGDPFKTLFVGRINYYTSESKIRREFESHGAIKKIRMVKNRDTEKPRGYCFIEYEHERDMHCEYHQLSFKLQTANSSSLCITGKSFGKYFFKTAKQTLQNRLAFYVGQ